MFFKSCLTALRAAPEQMSIPLNKLSYSLQFVVRTVMVLATTVLIKFFFHYEKIVHGAKHMYSIIRRGLQGTKLGTRPPNNINVVSYIHSQSRFSERLINDFTKLTGEHILAPHFSCVSRCNTVLTVTDQYTEGS